MTGHMAIGGSHVYMYSVTGHLSTSHSLLWCSLGQSPRWLL